MSSSYTTKNVNGVDVPLTEQEIADLQARDAAAKPAVPAKIDNWRGQLILTQRSLMAPLQSWISALTDPTEKAAATIALASADFTRDSPLMNTALKAIGQTDEQIDQLFIDAAALVI